MLKVRTQISLLIGFTLLLVACGNSGGRKAKLKKGGAKVKNGAQWISPEEVSNKVTVTEQVTDKSGKTTKTKEVSLACIDLPKLLAAIVKSGKNNDGKELLSITTYDLDFVTTAGDKRSPVTSIKNDDGSVKKQKGNYFFRAHKDDGLTHMTLASKFRDSKLAKKLFAVAENGQVKCASVILSDGLKGTPYEVISYTRRSLNLLRKTPPLEYRTYQLDGINQVRVSIVEEVNDIPTCGPGTVATHLVKREYMITRARDEQRIVIGRNLAELFQAYSSLPTPEIQEQLAARSARVRVSGSSYGYIEQLIKSGEATNLGCQ